MIGIFNRSHYEDVLVARSARGLGSERLPPRSRAGDIWKRRYREINDWERYLAGNGIAVVKMFLNMQEEQRRRFLRRIDQPEKNWKFSASDVRERRYWDDYQRAYSEMLSHTSTECASWYVLPPITSGSPGCVRPRSSRTRSSTSTRTIRLRTRPRGRSWGRPAGNWRPRRPTAAPPSPSPRTR